MSAPSIDPSLYRERDRVPIRRALVAVSDKTGLVELARALAAADVEIVSTGGTSKAIADAGIPVTQIGELTGFPEHLDGRVRTLHPKVHSGLLADLRLESHEAELASFGIEPFELVVVNLYPFAETVAQGAAPDAVIEQIDIGGPAMVRASAKNHANVAVVVSPARYGDIVDALAVGGTSLLQRRELALEAFRHTADYDIAVASWMGSVLAPDDEGSGFPGWAAGSWNRAEVLRYGENSHQRAALYRSPHGRGIAQAVQLQGKEMSYNNYVDADAALRAAYDHHGPAVAVIKHANPCGIATAGTIAEAHALAHACDPVSAYGGVIAANRPLTREAAESIAPIFTEVIVAPDFEPGALEVLAGKKNLRLLRLPEATAGARSSCASSRAASSSSRPTTTSCRRCSGSWQPATPPMRRPSPTSSSRGGRCAPSSRTRSCSPRAAHPWASAWARSTGSTRAASRSSARGSGRPARSPHPTRSSPSTTAPASCSRRV